MTYKILFAVIIMFIILFGLNKTLPFNLYNRRDALIVTVINSIIGAIIYIFITYKLGVIKDVFGKELINKIRSKLHLKVLD